MPDEHLSISPADRRIVRELAHCVAEAAASPRMAAVFRRWHNVNALRRPDRAPVWCRPVGAWREIMPESSLRCQGRFARDIERQFRRTLFKVELGDDTPVPAEFDVPVIFDVAPANTWGVDVAHRSTGQSGGAWTFDPPLKSEADFDRLVPPTWTLNEVATGRELSAAGDLLADILPVREVCRPAFDNATLGHLAADLRGLDNMIMDMIDRPGLLHRLMAYLRDARLAWLDAMESTGLIVPNTAEPMICSDSIGPAGGRVTLANCWCAGNSQEFDPVSPAMWEEFCLEYQRPIFARFGLACYGCCENLARKIAGVLTIPNLRIFVCSAWTTLNAALAEVPKNYCIMWRQKATDVVMPDDVEPIRAELLSGAKQLQGRPYQIVLRELETLGGHPDRLHAWTRLAIEAAERCA
jgi:hypothetical protein